MITIHATLVRKLLLIFSTSRSDGPMDSIIFVIRKHNHSIIIHACKRSAFSIPTAKCFRPYRIGTNFIRINRDISSCGCPGTSSCTITKIIKTIGAGAYTGATNCQYIHNRVLTYSDITNRCDMIRAKH